MSGTFIIKFGLPDKFCIFVNMKKTGIILLTVFYFIVASGFAINIHYCAGKIKTISFIQEDRDCCCGARAKTKGCCEEKTIVCKIDAKHKLDSKITIPDICTKEIAAYYTLLNFLAPTSVHIDQITPPDTSPPHLFSDQFFLINQNFRI